MIYHSKLRCSLLIQKKSPFLRFITWTIQINHFDIVVPVTVTVAVTVAVAVSVVVTVAVAVTWLVRSLVHL